MGHTTAAMQPGKKKIARATSENNLMPRGVHIYIGRPSLDHHVWLAHVVGSKGFINCENVLFLAHAPPQPPLVTLMIMKWVDVNEWTAALHACFILSTLCFIPSDVIFC